MKSSLIKAGLSPASTLPFLPVSKRYKIYKLCKLSTNYTFFFFFFCALKWVEQGIPRGKYFHKPRRWNGEKQSTCLRDVLCQHPVNSAQPIRTAAKWLDELSLSHCTDSASSANIHTLMRTYTHANAHSSETCTRTHAFIVNKQNLPKARKPASKLWCRRIILTMPGLCILLLLMPVGHLTKFSYWACTEHVRLSLQEVDKMCVFICLRRWC